MFYVSFLFFLSFLCLMTFFCRAGHPQRLADPRGRLDQGTRAGRRHPRPPAQPHAQPHLFPGEAGRAAAGRGSLCRRLLRHENLLLGIRPGCTRPGESARQRPTAVEPSLQPVRQNFLRKIFGAIFSGDLAAGCNCRRGVRGVKWLLPVATYIYIYICCRDS